MTPEIPPVVLRNNGWDSMRGAANSAPGLARIPNRRYTSGSWDSDSSCFPAPVTGVVPVLQTLHSFPALVTHVAPGLQRA